MLCPTCHLKLIASERAGVGMNYCPECHGVWLQRGCLDKIVDRCLDDAGELSYASETHVEFNRIAYADRSRQMTVNLYDTTA